MCFPWKSRRDDSGGRTTLSVRAPVGAIRKQPVSFDDDQPRPVGGVALWADRYTIERHVFEAATRDRNTLRIGVVVVAPRSRLHSVYGLVTG